MSDPFAEYKRVLDESRQLLERRGVEPKAPTQPRRIAARVVYRTGQIAVLIVLPFFVLIFSSVFVYRNYAVPTWPALLVGVLLTALILLFYAVWLVKRFSGGIHVSRTMLRLVLGVVGAYSLYALVYLSSLNVKDPEIRSYYVSLHPLLRVATSTFVLVDRDLVITDLLREPRDYVKMGLPIYEGSLHFKQEDGYAHAVDLRTVGHGELRNFLMKAYFRIIGFRTLRHVGTADHLHVSLPLP